MEKSRDFDVYNRVKILSLLKSKGSLTFSQLSNELKISRPAIYAHVNDLKVRGLVYLLEPDRKKKGSPVYIALTNQANPIELVILENTWGKWRELVDNTLKKSKKK